MTPKMKRIMHNIKTKSALCNELCKYDINALVIRASHYKLVSIIIRSEKRMERKKSEGLVKRVSLRKEENYLV